jgi:Rrf2 family protein
MFTKETEYALRALVYIQWCNTIGKRPGVDEISAETGSPRFFMAKILQRLSKAGLINSQKGKGGGFYFDETNPPLPIKNLVLAIEGDKTFTQCGFGLPHCNHLNPCPMHDKYAPIRQAINDLMTGETIQTLAHKYNELKATNNPQFII